MALEAQDIDDGRRREAVERHAQQLLAGRNLWNGRCTRLMADLYLTSIAAEPFTWGGTDLDVDGPGRATYIAALIKAVDTQEYADLIQFARGRRRDP